MPLLLLLFPIGQLPSARWQPLLWVGGMAAAAAFDLLRRRVHAAVGQRFNRSRLYADPTEAFFRQLRGASDVGQLPSQLERVWVMKPEHLSVWVGNRS